MSSSNVEQSAAFRARSGLQGPRIVYVSIVGFGLMCGLGFLSHGTTHGATEEAVRLAIRATARSTLLIIRGGVLYFGDSPPLADTGNEFPEEEPALPRTVGGRLSRLPPDLHPGPVRVGEGRWHSAVDGDRGRLGISITRCNGGYIERCFSTQAGKELAAPPSARPVDGLDRLRRVVLARRAHDSARARRQCRAAGVAWAAAVAETRNSLWIEPELTVCF